MAQLQQFQIRNRLIASLLADDFALMQPHLEAMTSELRQHLFREEQTITHVTFPESGIASIVADTAEGRFEVGMEGSAGWHKSRDLKLPEGITVLLLPPYSPELNPVENLWHYLRSHYLSNRSYADYDALLAAGTDAYRKLTPEVIRVGLPLRLHRRCAD